MPFALTSADQMTFLELTARVTLGFWFLLLLTRIMGRKQVSQLSFFDYTTGISIGAITASLAVNRTIPVWTALTALAIWTFWLMVVNAITLKSIPARKLLNSEPIMVIHKGKILERNLKVRYYNVNDLLMELRENGVFDPNEVEIGIAETDGKLSILKKSQFQPVTPNDLNLQATVNSANYAVGKELIIDGQIIYDNLIDNQLSQKWLAQQLSAQGIKAPSEVVLAAITPQGTLYIDKRQDDAPINQIVD